MGCPSDQTIRLTTGVTTVVAKWKEPVITDNSGSVSVQTNFPSSKRFTVGSHVVQYHATDPSRNSAYCSFKITIESK